jgi:hypothetical protein
VVALTVKVGGVVALRLTPGDVPPPGAGDTTVTVFEPTLAMSAAEMEAVNCVALENVVDRADPFHRTIDEDTNPVPFTVSVNAGPPAPTVAGDSELMAGAGLMEASTATTGLFAASVYVLLGKSRNSYWPDADGVVTVQLRLVTPVPTYVKAM